MAVAVPLDQPIPCRFCRKPMLADYPHRHDTPVRPDYDPMPPRPQTTAGMLALIRREYLAEIPARIHVAYVPSRAEPVAVSEYSAAAAGFIPTEHSEELLDTGALGSPSWSPAFHRYIGAAQFWEGEMVLADEELVPFPWTRQLEGLRRWCTGKHRTWYEHRQRPLCWLLVREVVEGGYSVGRAAELEHVSPEKAQELIGVAAGKWFAWVSNDLNGLDLRRPRQVV